MMALNDAVRFLLAWGPIGWAVFSIYVLVVFRTGLVYAAREQDGTLKRRQSLKGLLAMSTIVLGILGLLLLSNHLGLKARGVEPTFWQLFTLNYAYFLVLFLYDTLVIDYLVLSIWRPGFLALPEAMNRASMKVHIRASLLVGPLLGLLLAVAGSWMTHALLFR